MDTPEVRPWYKKKRYLGSLGLAGLLVIAAAAGSEPTPTTPAIQAAAVQQAVGSLPTLQVQAQSQTQVEAPTLKPVKPTNVPLSNDNYYTNSAGNEVHSPAYAPSEPAGATARCRDGTYSFSQSRRGTCSHHGGVAEWL